MNKLNVKSLVIIIVILAAAIVVGMYFYRTDVKLPKQVKIDTKNQPTMGNKNAKLHIVAFEDLKCHNCMRYNIQILPELKKKYIDTGKAKYTVMNVAFLPGSMPAANAARCLYKQNKKFFFPFVKYIYNHQPSEEKNWATLPFLVNAAGKIPGVNKKKLSQCIYKSPYTTFINKNLKIGMSIMNGSVATPTIYVNGYIVKPLTMQRLDDVISAVKRK